MVAPIHPDFHAGWIEWGNRAHCKLSYLTFCSLAPQHIDSSVVIGAHNDSLKASQNPQVSSESLKREFHFSVKHIVLHLILWKLEILV